jgi:hypothetical protein
MWSKRNLNRLHTVEIKFLLHISKQEGIKSKPGILAENSM